MRRRPAAPHITGIHRSTVHGSVIQIGRVTGNVTIVATPGATITQGEADSGLERLAVAVLQEANRQTAQRRLHDPNPLPVSWRTVGPPVCDHWSVIHGGHGETPLNLDGSLDDFVGLVSSQIPSGRLVLLGGPGAGKTSLVTTFTRNRLLARSEGRLSPNEPIPVMLRLSTWDPMHETLYQWIGRRIVTDYGVTGAIPVDRLFPVLDGLDEMTSVARSRALNSINASMVPASAGGPALVLTCRTEEYREAISREGADVLTGAAVIEIDGLPLGSVRKYLHNATKPGNAEKWSELFTRLENEPHGPLAEALASPLTVSLTRLAYAERSADPRELFNLPSRESVEAHLLSQVVPTFYPDPPEEPGPNERVRYRADAHRRLTRLARHLRASGTYDLEWWNLARQVPWVLRWLMIAAPSGLAIGLVANAQFGMITGPVIGLMAMIPVQGPKHGRMTLKRTGEASGLRLFRMACTMVLVTIVLGAFFALGMALSGLPWWTGFLAGSAVAVPGAVANEFLPLFDDVDIPRAVSPSGTFRSDRSWTLWFRAPFAVVGCTFAAAMLAHTSGLPLGITCGIVLLVVLALHSEWGRYQFARAWPTVFGGVPRDTMTFLEDACHRGVLRQVGGVYQFRHALLRDQLAAEAPRQGRRTPQQ